MQLITKRIEASLAPLGSTDGMAWTEKRIVFIKYFCPWSDWEWYVLEGEQEDDDWRFYGVVDGFEIELGYFMLSDLAFITGPGGLGIERDLHFNGQLPNHILKHLNRDESAA